MSGERLLDRIKMLLPGEQAKKEKEKREILLQRLGRIQPELRQMGVSVNNLSQRDDFSGKFATIINLSFDKRKSLQVRELLKSTGIEEVLDPMHDANKWSKLGSLYREGLINSESLKVESRIENIMVYQGKLTFAEQVDLLRLDVAKH